MRMNTGQIAYAPEGAPAGGDIVAPPVTPAAPAAPAAEHPVTAPWGSEGVWKFGETGKEAPWFSAIPEPEVRATMEAKQYANPGELAIAYNNLLKMQNGNPNVLALPGENATPEQLNEFYTKLGRPATKDAYDLKMGEGVTADPKMVEFGKDVAFDLGLNTVQAQKLTDRWNAFAAEMGAGTVEQNNAKNDAEIAALETKWGGDAQKFKDAGLTALKALGSDAPDLIGKVEGAIGTAAVVVLLARIGKGMGEGGIPNVPPANPNDPASMSHEAAQARITQLQGDPAFNAKYTDKNHPEHASAVEMMKVLFSR